LANEIARPLTAGRLAVEPQTDDRSHHGCLPPGTASNPASGGDLGRPRRSGTYFIRLGSQSTSGGELIISSMTRKFRPTKGKAAR
jgi:hypothetical protein